VRRLALPFYLSLYERRWPQPRSTWSTAASVLLDQTGKAATVGRRCQHCWRKRVDFGIDRFVSFVGCVERVWKVILTLQKCFFLIRHSSCPCQEVLANVWIFRRQENLLWFVRKFVRRKEQGFLS